MGTGSRSLGEAGSPPCWAGHFQSHSAACSGRLGWAGSWAQLPCQTSLRVARDRCVLNLQAGWLSFPCLIVHGFAEGGSLLGWSDGNEKPGCRHRAGGSAAGWADGCTQLLLMPLCGFSSDSCWVRGTVSVFRPGRALVAGPPSPALPSFSTLSCPGGSSYGLDLPCRSGSASVAPTNNEARRPHLSVHFQQEVTKWLSLMAFGWAGRNWGGGRCGWPRGTMALGDMGHGLWLASPGAPLLRSSTQLVFQAGGNHPAGWGWEGKGSGRPESSGEPKRGLGGGEGHTWSQGRGVAGFTQHVLCLTGLSRFLPLTFLLLCLEGGTCRSSGPTHGIWPSSPKSGLRAPP